jgi:hypothetical protein
MIYNDIYVYIVIYIVSIYIYMHHIVILHPCLWRWFKFYMWGGAAPSWFRAP